MLATRFRVSNTSSNLLSLKRLVIDPNCVELRLFGTASKIAVGLGDEDEADTNLPLVAAVAKYTIPGITDVYVVFDGMVLTAARLPRYFEVQELLDKAVASKKVTFASVPAPFTSSFDPAIAADKLLSIGPVIPLSEQTRAHYFSMLSTLTEEAFAKLNSTE
ncbi:hypothetical protein ACUHMQ_16550 [Chitinimonas sp. PSY-7]|uniref:hypothetical protein n=1 Tax=Chitinimonas sp. PSY-7 TaxID=3459088 RepID=UPI0040403C1E